MQNSLEQQRVRLTILNVSGLDVEKLNIKSIHEYRTYQAIFFCFYNS